MIFTDKLKQTKIIWQANQLSTAFYVIATRTRLDKNQNITFKASIQVGALNL